MELPSHLLRTHRKYKLQEKDLLQWICDNSSLDKITTQQTPAFKLSGRARTLARRAADEQTSEKHIPVTARSSKSTSTDHVRAPCLTLLQIMPHVQNIADNCNINLVPEFVATNFQSIVELRQKCFSWFRQNTAQDDEKTREQNRKHAYPIDLLLEAMRILATKMPQFDAKQKPEQKQCDVSVDAVSSSNTFELLSLDEGLMYEDEITAGQTTVETETQNNTPKSTALPKVDQEEAVSAEYKLATFCYLEDLKEIEDFILLELARYSMDESNAGYLGFLISAACDLAIMMFHSYSQLLDEDFEQEHRLSMRNVRSIHAALAQNTSPSEQESLPEQIHPLERLRICLTCISSSASTDEHWTVDYPHPELDYYGHGSDVAYLLETAFVGQLMQSRPPRDDREYSPFFKDISADCAAEAIYRQEMHLRSLTNENEEFPFFRSFLSSTFCLRLQMLADNTLRRSANLPFQRFIDCAQAQGSFAVRQMKFCLLTPNYEGGIKLFWKTHGKHISDIAESLTDLENILSPRLEAVFKSSPLLCLFNISQLQYHQAVCGILNIQFSAIALGLSHLWNLLQEEGLLNVSWPDTEHFVRMMGEEAVYSGHRPTLKDSPRSILHNQIIKAIGLTKKLLKNFETHSMYSPGCRAKLYTKRFIYDNPPCLALSPLFARRPDKQYSDAEANIEDAQLVVTATEIPMMLGQKTSAVKTVDGVLHNRTELWKLVQKGPGLQPVQLPATMKKKFQRETATYGFDYIGFQVTCAVLVQLLDTAYRSDEADDSGYVESTTDTVWVKLYNVLLIVIKNPQRAKLEDMAVVFERWLAQYGDVGIRKMQKGKSTPVPDTINSFTVNMVQDIVRRRGLLEDVFTPEQLAQLGDIKVTGNIEDEIRDAWETHKKRRR